MFHCESIQDQAKERPSRQVHLNGKVNWQTGNRNTRPPTEIEVPAHLQEVDKAHAIQQKMDVPTNQQKTEVTTFQQVTVVPVNQEHPPFKKKRLGNFLNVVLLKLFNGEKFLNLAYH